LPVGVQILGDRFQELLCLEAADARTASSSRRSRGAAHEPMP
jgi:Asp-tRNA(Asn)/Glu-tRNA(Gln) amidotransferase A subunit family amidase